MKERNRATKQILDSKHSAKASQFSVFESLYSQSFNGAEREEIWRNNELNLKNNTDIQISRVKFVHFRLPLALQIAVLSEVLSN